MRTKYRVLAFTNYGRLVREANLDTHEEVLALEANIARHGTSICHWRVYTRDRDGAPFMIRAGRANNAPGWVPVNNYTGD